MNVKRSYGLESYWHFYNLRKFHHLSNFSQSDSSLTNYSPRPSQKFPLIKSLPIFQVSLNTNPFFKRMCFKSSSECKDEHPWKRIIIKKVPFSFSYTFISWFQNFCQNLTTVLFTAWVFVEFLRKQETRQCGNSESFVMGVKAFIKILRHHEEDWKLKFTSIVYWQKV